MKPFRLIYALLPLLLVIGCSDDNSPEQQIRERVRQIELAAEAREKLELSGIISDDYQDDHNRVAKDVRKIIVGLIIRNKQIHLLAKVRSVTMASETEGTAVVLMGMLGQQEADQLPLPMIRAELYRFSLTFRNEGGEWNLINSEAERASPEDLLE